MTDKEMEKWLDAKTAELTEHFDAVQILASYTDETGTHFIKRGSGNWFARMGMAQDYLTTQNAQTGAEMISRELKSNQ